MLKICDRSGSVPIILSRIVAQNWFELAQTSRLTYLPSPDSLQPLTPGLTRSQFELPFKYYFPRDTTEKKTSQKCLNVGFKTIRS